MKKRMLVIAAAVATSMMMASPVMADDFKVGICNYVDDASLNQIVDNIQSRLEELGEEKGVTFDVSYDNCNADANVMEQIISDFQADNVDLMVGVATPVAMRMQSATEGSDTPVVFSAVSDPVGSGLVDSLDAPGANITGTSDYLDTSSIMKLIQAQNPDVKIVAVEPATSPVLSKGEAGPHKIQGIGAGFVPDTLNTKIYDEVIAIENEDAFVEGRSFAKSEGILVGISSGAALKAAQILAARPENAGKTIVALLPDSGDRYLSTALFNEQ